MAQDMTSQPWLLDATGQSYARDAVATVGNNNTLSVIQKLWIREIKVDTGDGGNVLVSVSNGGRRLLKMDNTTANTTISVPIDELWEGLYVTTLPANASLEVYHGRD